jgi:hypothetical protein
MRSRVRSLIFIAPARHASLGGFDCIANALSRALKTHVQSDLPGTFHLFIPREAAVQKALKLVSYAVLALMASAVVYAGLIGITYWTGIGV